MEWRIWNMFGELVELVTHNLKLINCLNMKLRHLFQYWFIHSLTYYISVNTNISHFLWFSPNFKLKRSSNSTTAYLHITCRRKLIFLKKIFFPIPCSLFPLLSITHFWKSKKFLFHEMKMFPSKLKLIVFQEQECEE